MSEHTPGPWFFSFESVDPEWAIITISGGFVVANVNSHQKQEANARLIAAAPDMLVACEALVLYDSNDTDDVKMMINYNNAIELAKAAIAKAKGDA